METKKIKIEGKEYMFTEDDPLIKNLIEDGHLEKINDGYKWTEKHIKLCIKNARRLNRFLESKWYRFWRNLFR